LRLCAFATVYIHTHTRWFAHVCVLRVRVCVVSERYVCLQCLPKSDTHGWSVQTRLTSFPHTHASSSSPSSFASALTSSTLTHPHSSTHPHTHTHTHSLTHTHTHSHTHTLTSARACESSLFASKESLLDSQCAFSNVWKHRPFLSY